MTSGSLVFSHDIKEKTFFFSLNINIKKGNMKECLSEKYLGGKKYLNWRCKNGHEWTATPNNRKSYKNWCQECKKENKN